MKLGIGVDIWNQANLDARLAEEQLSRVRLAGRTWYDIEIQAGARVSITDDVQRAIDQAKPQFAFLVGATAPGSTTSTATPWCGGDLARPPSASRSCSWPGAGTRRWPRCPTSTSTTER